MQKVCGVPCANKFVQMENERKEEREWKAYKKKWKEENKSLNDYAAEAQVWFNSYIRERDKNEPCISCGKFMKSQDVGGTYDCGHFRSIGAAKHMRFHEDNAHKQCKKCNRDLSGNSTEYRKRLIEKIGLERVEAVENNNEIRKFTRDELREIKKLYKQKCKDLKSE